MPKNPGCDAAEHDNTRDQLLLPVCMGGAAIEGAMASIIGCNNADICRSQLRDVPGQRQFVTVAGNKVVAHTTILVNEQTHTAPVHRPRVSRRKLSDLLIPLTSERADEYKQQFDKSAEEPFLPTDVIIAGLV